MKCIAVWTGPFTGRYRIKPFVERTDIYYNMYMHERFLTSREIRFSFSSAYEGNEGNLDSRAQTYIVLRLTCSTGDGP